MLDLPFENVTLPEKILIKNLIIITGPPAVGKMTVGKALSEATGYKLLYNHISIEVALQFFDFGTSGFRHISESVRTAVFEATLDSESEGLIFTYVWAFDDEKDNQYIAALIEKWESSAKRKTYVLELSATEEAKKERNKHADRLKAKPSKRNIQKSEKQRKLAEKQHKLNSLGDFPLNCHHLCIDNTEMEPIDVAEKFINTFKIVYAAPRLTQKIG